MKALQGTVVLKTFKTLFVEVSQILFRYHIDVYACQMFRAGDAGSNIPSGQQHPSRQQHPFRAVLPPGGYIHTGQQSLPPHQAVQRFAFICAQLGPQKGKCVKFRFSCTAKGYFGAQLTKLLNRKFHLIPDFQEILERSFYRSKIFVIFVSGHGMGMYFAWLSGRLND